MKPPIKVIEGNDVNIFSSVEKAEMYMEAIDVENNEYIVTDADGKILPLSIEKKTVSTFLGDTRVKVVKINDPEDM